jgi:fructan beta-fructosidase
MKGESTMITKSGWRGFGSAAAVAALAAGLLAAVPAVADEGGPDPATEQYRPYLHFSPERNWMNDPNGMVYHDGTWHLFFQHNPDGNRWGNMSWGHATSTDLVHWEEQPIAIPQTFDENGTAIEDIFSGSVVVDEGNTSGFGTAGTRRSSRSTRAPTPRRTRPMLGSRRSRSRTAPTTA